MKEYQPLNTQTHQFDFQSYHTQIEMDKMFDQKEFYKVDYFLTIYKELDQGEWRKHYLEKTLYGIKAIDYPIRIIVIHDYDASQHLLDFVKSILPDAIFKKRSIVPNQLQKYLSCEWGLNQSYNESDADFVCFNHSDDIPFANRVDVQIQSLLTNPKAVLSLASQYISINRQTRQLGFHEVQRRGSPFFSCPSSFMWNKKLLPKIEEKWNQWIDLRTCWDLAIILEMLQQYEVVAVHLPLFIYNFRGLFLQPEDQLKADQEFFQYCQKYNLCQNKEHFKIYP